MADNSTEDTLLYKDSFHACQVLAKLEKLFQDKKLCDVVLVIGDCEIEAHRAVLAANSLYFYSMFTSGMCESIEERVLLREVESHAVEQLVRFCYTSTIEINEKNVQNLLSVANLLQFTTVIETCCAFLKKTLHPSNCLGIEDFAEHHGCQKLQMAAEMYAQKHFLEVAQTDEFLAATPEQVLTMLQSDSLNIATEKEVFDAVIQWIQHDIDRRNKWLPEMLRLVRLPLLPPKILVDCIEGNKLIESNDVCMRILSETKNFHLLPERRDKLNGHLLSNPRKVDHEAMMYVIGGEIHSYVFNTVERFDFENESWDMVAPMHKKRDGLGVATYSGLIYAAGGCDGDVALSSVECYNPTTNKWSYVNSMTCGRHAFSLVEHDGWIYAAGGSDFSRTEYNTVERYDPVRDVWEPTTSMSATREGVQLVSLDGAVYAVGGDNGVSILNSVERYDPRIDQWSACVPMSYRRRYFGAAVLKHKIYVVGGSDYDEDHNSVECYDPRMNRWLSLPPLLMRRESPAAAVHDDKLYVLGGAYMTSESNTVDQYDPLSNKWEAFTPLTRAIEGMGVVVV